jgi:alkanesulfonate monooxygenase SsuD/methylene tetrahydromethanopterin reductase-like flavin-dependent oxidoreductase (luciferase family)
MSKFLCKGGSRTHMLPRMRFGWLTLAHSPDSAGDHAAIHEQLAQACFAETAGFDGIWLTEHNFTGESVYCDPIPFASALAARTSRIRIGFAVIQLALRHPIRLATQLALLDNLSNGRLDVGVGHGTNFNEYEFVGYGLRSDDSRARMEETLEVMVRAWTEAPLRHEGKFYQLRLPELRPRVRQRPHPPIWRSASSAGSVREWGRLGAPILLARIPLARVPERLALYETGLAESAEDDATRRRLRDQAAVWRFVHVADSQGRAEEELTAALIETRRHMVHARAAYNPADFTVEPSRVNPWNDPRVSHEEGVRYSLEAATLYGTPRRVAEQVAELRDAGARHVLCQMSYGYLPHARIMESMRAFGEQVMPRFR